MSKAPAISLDHAHHGEALIDAHTPLHALVGFTAGILGVDPHVAMLTFIGARIVEASLRSGTKHALFEREGGQSLGNEMSDLLFEMAGLHAGEHLRHHLLAQAPVAPPVPAAGLGRMPHNPYVGHHTQWRPY